MSGHDEAGDQIRMYNIRAALGEHRQLVVAAYSVLSVRIVDSSLLDKLNALLRDQQAGQFRLIVIEAGVLRLPEKLRQAIDRIRGKTPVAEMTDEQLWDVASSFRQWNEGA